MFITEALASYVQRVISLYSTIPSKRRKLLEDFSGVITTKLNQDKQTNLIFICTHNSRRSHFAQIWAQVASSFFGLEGISTFSGGMETTAFNERAVNALISVGFEISALEGDNPKYQLRYSDKEKAIEVFSKRFDEKPNPKSDFFAVMTCSDVDETCPLVPGAIQRIPLYYKDPKEADDTPQEVARYEERCLLIATEMFYLFAKIREKL